MERLSAEGADAILGKVHRVLDYGSVVLVDYLGSDEMITNAARTSMGKGTKTLRDDESLLRYMFRHGHTGPFEFCEAVFLVKVPLYVWAQWKRHRTASINERSHRYSEAENEFQIFGEKEWRIQSKDNKQGSNGHINSGTGERLSDKERRVVAAAVTAYEERLVQGVAREQARTILPQNLYTVAYWKIDLHNLLHFLSLRMDEHAQKEIRDYANVIASIVAEWVPMTWEAFYDYKLQAVTFTGPEVEALQKMFQGLNPDKIRQIYLKGSKRERSEFAAKLVSLGLCPEVLKKE